MIEWTWPTPATFTKASIRPDSDLVCPASRAMFSGRVTLAGTATAWPPPTVIPAFTASSSLAPRAARTVQPLRASLMASPCRKKKGQ
jgi:hypothetical protein